ncbi:MAG: glutathione-regulated potassium-efflux system protein KefC [Thermoanaerobaculia bacterium]|nr:glutathione-regulated potassium-efflux system protein KefC [Thermoanaerobaculia bacterium]
MHAEGFFLQAFVYLSAAVVSVPVAKRLGLGSVLGYLLAGIAIGPFGLELIGEEGQDVMHFAEFGVVMMLFLIGLELEPGRLWRLRGPILGLGGLQVGITTLAIAGVALAVGQSWRVALAVGMILALSSTAMVLQTLAEKGLMKTDAGQSAFSVLLFQDIAVIPMLALLPLLAAPGDGAHHGADHAHGHGGHVPWVQTLPPWAETLAVLGAVALVVVGGRFLMRPAFRFIARTGMREIFTAAALLLVIGIALLMAQVGLSPALGTFLAGVVLANSEYRHELEGDVEPFKGLLLGLFFIAVGASVDFRLISESPGSVAAMVAGLVVLKLLVLVGLARVFRMGLDQTLLFAFALAQGGEFAFVLFSFATQNAIFGDEVAAPLIAAVAVSMALTPLLLVLAEKVLLPRVGTKESVARPADEISSDSHNDQRAIIAGFGRFGNIVGRLLRANGVKPTVLDNNSDRVDVLRKLGLEVFYGDATRLDLLHAAGAEEAKLMVVALESQEQNLELVETARKHFPHLTLLVRADDRFDAYRLLDEGVDHVYRETLDTSLAAGVDALCHLGFRRFQATRSANKFRCHDEETLRELAEMRHDRKQYMNHARERIRFLEETLQAEHHDPTERDAGWDVESLREDLGG